MPLGVGAGAAGTSIAGYGSVDASPVQQQTILIDAVTGLPQSARKIDPVTKQFVLDTYGRIQGMGGVQQLVELRANTLLNSSAVQGLGMVAPSGVQGSNIIRRLTEEINQAMKDLVDGKLIQVLGVKVEKVAGTNAIRRYFTWRDLTVANNNQAGSEQKTNF